MAPATSGELAQRLAEIQTLIWQARAYAARVNTLIQTFGCDRLLSATSCRERQLPLLKSFNWFDEIAIRVQTLGFLLNAIPHEVVPIPIKVGAAHVQHR